MLLFIDGFGLSLFTVLAVIFMLRASAIQWGLYYPKWLMYGNREA